MFLVIFCILLTATTLFYLLEEKETCTDFHLSYAILSGVFNCLAASKFSKESFPFWMMLSYAFCVLGLAIYKYATLEKKFRIKELLPRNRKLPD